MQKKWTILLFSATLACLQGCKDPYDSPAIRTSPQYLVVNGFLNASADSTILTLSRTRNLNDSIPYYPEPLAQVTVLGEFGERIPLQEQPGGRYVSPSLNLNLNENYSLEILTADRNKYVSENIQVKQSPPIDSISWRQDSTSAANKIGVNIFANTHDPSGNTRYYQWEYEETWEYHAAYESFFKYIGGGMVVPRADSEKIFVCYKDIKSTELQLATSAHLSQDLIFEKPLVFIPNTDQRLSYRYSILVRQYAISPEAYDYWQNLKKNTELTGSIFDALPSQGSGNLHCETDPTQPVLGFLSASTVQMQRIFISYRQLGPWYYVAGKGCELFTTGNSDPLIFWSGGLIPLYQTPTGFFATTPNCADCRLQGGVLQKPAFW